jgi:alcohol dehydrogenase class IV
VYHYLPIALKEPENMEARTELMRASLYGGLAIAQTSTTLQHSIGYPLTSEYDIPHGLANGIVMKSIMELYYPVVSKPLEDLFSYLGISRKQFYQWLETLQLSIDVHLSQSFIDEKLDEVLASRNMANNPMEIGSAAIRKIFEELSK